MKRFGLLLLGLALLVGAAYSYQPVRGQSTPQCDPAALIAEITALQSTGNQAQDMELLLEIQKRIETQNIACNGFAFTGRGNRLLGPFDIPAGFYRVRVSTWDYMFGAEIVSVGEGPPCVEGFMAEQLFTFLMNADNMMGSTNESIHEASFQTRGCRMAIQVEATSMMGARDWTLTIEPLR